MNKQTKTTLAAFLATSVAVFAGSSTKNAKLTESVCDCSVNLTGSIGIDLSSGYINKGRQFDTSAVFQPFVSVVVPTSLELGGVKVGFVGSTKQNLFTQDPLRTFGRSEYNAGIALNKDRFSLISTYEYVTSKNDWFPEAQGVNLVLNFNDSDLLPVALNPHAKTYLGVKRNNQPVGNYYEVGISPSTTVYNTKVSVPVTVGVGDKNFYTSGEAYGYTSAGVTTSTPLADHVSLTTGVTYFNTNEKNNAGNKNLWLTSVGVVVNF